MLFYKSEYFVVLSTKKERLFLYLGYDMIFLLLRWGTDYLAFDWIFKK